MSQSRSVVEQCLGSLLVRGILRDHYLLDDQLYSDWPQLASWRAKRSMGAISGPRSACSWLCLSSQFVLLQSRALLKKHLRDISVDNLLGFEESKA